MKFKVKIVQVQLNSQSVSTKIIACKRRISVQKVKTCHIHLKRFEQIQLDFCLFEWNKVFRHNEYIWQVRVNAFMAELSRIFAIFGLQSKFLSDNSLKVKSNVF